MVKYIQLVMACCIAASEAWWSLLTFTLWYDLIALMVATVFSNWLNNWLSSWVLTFIHSPPDSVGEVITFFDFLSVRPFIRLSGQILLQWCLMNSLINLDKTDREYSPAPYWWPD